MWVVAKNKAGFERNYKLKIIGKMECDQSESKQRENRGKVNPGCNLGVKSKHLLHCRVYERGMIYE